MILCARKTAVFVLLLLLLKEGWGQSYYFSHYEVDDGLSNNTVNTIVQDSRGLIWMGTNGGLNRFDGYSFKSYGVFATGNIGGNSVLCIAEDKAGLLWIGTDRGLFRYNPYSEQIEQLTMQAATNIDRLLVDRNGDLWFLAHNILKKYTQATGAIFNTGILAGAMAMDATGDLWPGDWKGHLNRYHPSTGQLIKMPLSIPHSASKVADISRLFPVNDSVLLIGTHAQGLQYYDINTAHTRPLLVRSDDQTEIFVRDILDMGNGQFWAATESGIYTGDLWGNDTHHFQKSSGDPYSLSDNAVYCLLKDRRGGIWAGTYFGGVNYYARESARFRKYYPLPGANSITGNAVREICADHQGNIWIGTEDAGISKLDPPTGRFTNFTPTVQPSTLSYPNIQGLLATNNHLYIGLFHHGLEVMNLQTGRITTRLNTIGEKGQVQSDFVTCIYQTLDGRLLMGTKEEGAGLYEYDTTTRTFHQLHDFPGLYVYAIKEDHEGTLWAGSLEKGAFYNNPRTGKKGNIRFGGAGNDSLSHDYKIQGIYEDSDKCLWFATGGGGLIRLLADRKTFKRFTTSNGLPCNDVFRMLEDDQHRLWISSVKGLICFDLATEKISTYTMANGLPTDQFNFNSAFKDKQGRLYFGTIRGMISFLPADFNKTDPAPPVYLTGFQIDNKEVLPDAPASPLKRSMLFTDSISLTYDQSSFNIEFAALEYAAPRVVRYRYRMEGLSDEWTYLHSNRKVYFTHLSPGRYTFILQASSNTGSWQGEEKQLFIRIYPPFWASPVAYCGYALFILLLLLFSIVYYRRYMERKHQRRLQLFEHEKEKEVYEAKIEFFTNIAHEIQTPLTLIIGPVEMVIKKLGDAPGISNHMQMIRKNANRLLSLTGQLLDFRKTEVDQFGLNFVKVNITHLLEEQVVVFKARAEKENIRLHLSLPDEPVMAFADPEALVKIWSNLISNAIKYASSQASISLKAGEQSFSMQFSNDGKMIPKEYQEKIFDPFFRLPGNTQRGTGIGLSLARSLTELHNGTLQLVTTTSPMTIFELTLPLRQKIEFELNTWKNLNRNERQHSDH